MHEFGTLPDELPDAEFSREALSELQRIVTKTGRLLTIAAVSLAAEQGKSVGQTVQVDRDDVLEAAKFLFVPQCQNRIAWLNDGDVVVEVMLVPIHPQRFALERDRCQFDETHAGNRGEVFAGGFGNLAVQITLAHIANSLRGRQRPPHRAVAHKGNRPAHARHNEEGGRATD